ncbi:MAG: N-6 DNA methylase [Parahaliea sp.]
MGTGVTDSGTSYQYRKEEERYSRCVSMEEIEKNDFNLNISRYVSTAEPEPEIDLAVVHRQLVDIGKRIDEAARTHNQYLAQLGLPPVS